MQRLRDEKFDFAFTEYFDMCGFAVIEKIGVKRYGGLLTSSMSQIFTSMYGIPSTLSFVPEMATSSMPPMGLLDRAKNIMISVMSSLFFYPKMVGPIRELSRKYVRPDFDLSVRLII